MAPPRLRNMAAMLSVPGNKKDFGKRLARVLFSNLGLFVLVAIYACGGAYIYILLESGNEAKQRQIKRLAVMDVEDSKKYIISLLWYQNTQNLTKKQFTKMVMSNLEVFNQYVVTNAMNSEIQFDGQLDTWDYQWTFPNALLFTISSIEVIGYGNVVPKTSNGRFFTIIYNVIGIPLLLVFLANIGDFLASSCRYIYSRVCCRWCRAKRHLSQLKNGKTLEKHAVWKDEVGSEPYMPTEKVEVPIMVNLCMITVYVLLCGFLFSHLEQWDMISAIYFTFITLSTIGFGDLVPGKSFSGAGNRFAAGITMLATVIVTLFGMALLSMCINLMQEQMVKKVQYMMMSLGLKDEDIDPMEKYKYKKSELGTVMETNKDRDGNKRLNLINTNEGESTTSKPPTYSNIEEELEDV